MKESTKQKIKDSIRDLKDIGGLNNPEMKSVIVKLKLALENEVKSEK